MSFKRTRTDGVEVEIVSIDSVSPDFYQWGKNCANLEQSEEEARRSLTTYGIGFTAEQSDEFWYGFMDHQVKVSS